MDTTRDTGDARAGPRRPHRRVAALILSGAFLALAVGVLTYRAARLMNVPGAPDATHWVMQDFRDAIYFPVRCLLDGGNPYDVRVYVTAYPVGQTFAPYSPLLLLLHAPLGLLPLATAQAVYLVVNLLLTVGLAQLVLRVTGGASLARTLLLAGAILLSRPGQLNVLVGQATLLLVAGVYLALIFGQHRPAWSALGLALTGMKPTYAVPLALLMLARGDWRPVLLGGALAVLGAALGAVGPVLAAGGPAAFAALLPHNYAVFAAQTAADPMLTVHRVDAGVILARLLGRPPGTLLDAALFAAIVGIGALSLRRTPRADLALSAGIACSTILACVYQSSYNLILLVLPAVALLRARRDTIWLHPSWLRAVLGLAYAGLALNYLASENAARLLDFGSGLRALVATLNSTGVLVLFVAYCAVALRRPAVAREVLASARSGGALHAPGAAHGRPLRRSLGGSV